jgi:hypothetical protein
VAIGQDKVFCSASGIGIVVVAAVQRGDPLQKNIVALVCFQTNLIVNLALGKLFWQWQQRR